MTTNPAMALEPSTRKRMAGRLSLLWREVCRPFRSRKASPQNRAAAAPPESALSCRAGPLIPSMITHQEADFFARCAHRSSVLEGKIVDLGCWMGSTAIALANGAQRAGKRDRIAAFDIFIWKDWMNEAHPKLVHGVYQEGESFLPEARRIVQDHGHGLVDLIAADLKHFAWTDGPIKLLLVDAMKTMGLMERIATNFFTCVPTGGFVLHQDFKHRHTPWIHVLHYRLRDHFRFMEDVTPGGTVGFQVVKGIPASQVAAAVRFDGLTEAEADAAFEHSLSLLDSNDRSEVAGAHLEHYCLLKRVDKVRHLADHYAGLGMDVVSSHPLASKLLQLPESKAA